jgi:hypothetical protein
MRSFLFIAALSATAAPAVGATRTFEITSFSKVRVDGPYKVTLKTGVAPFASATGSQAALDRIAIDVRGDTLVIRSSLDSWGGYPGQDVGPVEISLGTHDLWAAWLNGSGALSIDKVKGLSFDLSVQGSGVGTIADTNVDQLQVNVVGTASARLAGQAAKMTAVIRGISSLDAAALTTKDENLAADGAGTIAEDVTNSVTVNATGPATVRLTGAPSCTLRVAGSAIVSGCH